MSQLTTDHLKDAIEYAGYQWREYSGRCMYGKQCVGVTLPGPSALYTLGQSIDEYCNDYDLPTFPAPVIDGMGTGIIAYWPRFAIVDAA